MIWFHRRSKGQFPVEVLSADEHEKNNLPDILSRWSAREGSEKDNERTAQSFCVPKSDIEEQNYDLSIKSLQGNSLRRNRTS